MTYHEWLIDRLLNWKLIQQHRDAYAAFLEERRKKNA